MIEVEEYRPTYAESVANVVAKSGTVSYRGVLKTLSFRVPLDVIASVDAMADQAGNSRNSMLVLLVRAGLEAVRAELPPEVREHVDAKEFEMAALAMGLESGEL